MIFITNQVIKKIESIVQTPDEHRNQMILEEVTSISKLYGITMKELADLIYKNFDLELRVIQSEDIETIEKRLFNNVWFL